MTRHDGKWAGFNFEHPENTPWDTIEKSSPELWNSLSPDAQVTTESPEAYVIFDYLDDLIEWICLANEPNFMLVGNIPDKDDLEIRFCSESEAINLGEDIWFGIPEKEKDVSKLAVLRLPDMEVVWCRGL